VPVPFTGGALPSSALAPVAADVPAAAAEALSGLASAVPDCAAPPVAGARAGLSCTASASTASPPSSAATAACTLDATAAGLSSSFPLFMTSFAGFFGRSNTIAPSLSWWWGMSPPGCPCAVPSACV